MGRKPLNNGVESQPSDIGQSRTKSSQPLVFISHDTRDADLAEEFSTLLRNASAGALKSFRSSDKKGTQGIEYGLEWYPAIMDKIDEASDVVCLLTQNSVDRPWILYEAGVAKGKLNTKVIGVALGIPLSEAVNGPFAQFQNNDGDIDSVTKLVYDLVKKVPGLDPDRQTVKTLVELFLKKVTDLVKSKSKTKEQRQDAENDSSVVKLFEEVKIMFQDLPAKIERRSDVEKRKILKLDPKYILNQLHFFEKKDDFGFNFLIAISFYKNDFPWLYEIGLETYRTIRESNSPQEIQTAHKKFREILEMTFRHPMMRDFIGYEKDSMFFFEDLRYLLSKQLDWLINKKKKPEKDKESLVE